MLVGITGTICAGKTTVAQYLVEKYGFTRLVLGVEEDDTSAQHFKTPSELMDYVMTNWTRDFVIDSLHRRKDLDVFLKRPFFLLVHVDAPLMRRFQSWASRKKSLGHQNTQLETFIALNDHQAFGSDHKNSTNTSALLPHVSLHIINTCSSLQEFHKYLDKLDLTNIERVRPGWDSYFMQLCDLAARRSNCMKRSVGAILVKSNRVISTGYNGTPRGVKNCNEGGCKRCNSNAKCGTGLDLCLCLHAEENALLEAGRHRVEGDDVILYCNTCPCLSCAKKIIQVGIKEVVYSHSYGMDNATRELLDAAGVKLRQWKGVGLTDSGEGRGTAEDVVNELSRKVNGMEILGDVPEL